VSAGTEDGAGGHPTTAAPSGTPGDRTTAKARPPLDEEVVIDGHVRKLDDLDEDELEGSAAARHELAGRLEDEV
jgi:hypothetical protein